MQTKHFLDFSAWVFHFPDSFPAIFEFPDFSTFSVTLYIRAVYLVLWDDLTDIQSDALRHSERLSSDQLYQRHSRGLSLDVVDDDQVKIKAKHRTYCTPRRCCLQKKINTNANNCIWSLSDQIQLNFVTHVCIKTQQRPMRIAKPWP